VVKLGIIKGTVSRRKQKAVLDPMISSQPKEIFPRKREVVCTWNQPVHSQIKMFGLSNQEHPII
jgi:hypothetical protein